MKKTILAMAVPALLAAGSASASITLYDADGTSVELSGAAEVQYRRTGAEDFFDPAKVYLNKVVGGASTEDGQIRVDDGDLAFRITHQEGDNYAFGAIELRIGEQGDEANANFSGSGDVVNDGLYVGFGGNWGELSFGRQLAIIDDAGVGVDYELKDVAGVDFEDTDFDQLIKYRYSGEGYWAGASYNVSQDDASGSNSDRLYELAGGVNVIDSVEVRAYYANFKNEATADVDQTAWDLEVAYNEGPFYAGILYGQFESENKAGVKTQDVDVIEIAGSYSKDKSKFGAGAAFNDGQGREESTSYYINYGYNLLTNCKLYAEVGYEDFQADDAAGDWDGVGYVAGIEVKF
ncbi:porin [Enterovibrio paralichthyis]|uniref:porin n=1 Tax=Enterovibrio paralichthyis TaxID=2853805 RepID=UPI001C4866AA|nr:porin [Enterovibrio paralichthyis]MBV7299579.1 porin [Enterovibrio paralichthyis]